MSGFENNLLKDGKSFGASVLWLKLEAKKIFFHVLERSSLPQFSDL
jgi:hypothetical protein